MPKSLYLNGDYRMERTKKGKHYVIQSNMRNFMQYQDQAKYPVTRRRPKISCRCRFYTMKVISHEVQVKGPTHTGTPTKN